MELQGKETPIFNSGEVSVGMLIRVTPPWTDERRHQIAIFEEAAVWAPKRLLSNGQS